MRNDLSDLPFEAEAELEELRIENGRRALRESIKRGEGWWHLLHQTEWWRAEAGPVRLDDMNNGHRANLLNWLDARAAVIAYSAGWYWVAELGRHHGDIASKILEKLADAEWDAISTDPHGWLQATPFYLRMVELLDADHVDVDLPARSASVPVPRLLTEV